MSEEEKRVLAERFIADAVREMGGSVDDDSYELAIQKAASALPPFSDADDDG